MRVSQLPDEERPRERLLSKGPESLSVPELLAILLRTGTAGEGVLEYAASLLNRWGGLEGLCRARPSELMQEKGLKEAKVATISAVIELGRRIAMVGAADRSSWNARIRELANETRFADREQIFAIFLDAREKVLDDEVISYGGQSGAYMDVSVFYRKAVRLNAHSVVLVHNHPDGSPFASREDVALTEHLRQGLKLLGIGLLGHYIAAGGTLTQVP
jgi:DNA repair protein RadC